MKFIEFSKKINECTPIVLAEGEEAYFREKVVDSLREQLIAQPILNDVRYEGEELKGDKLVAFRDSLSVLPFLSEYRMVRVYEFYPTEKEYEQVLKGYFENPCPSTRLLIVNRAKKAGGVDLKRKANVTFVDCAKESEEVVGKWLFGTMRRAGLSTDMDVVQRMVRYCANDCARLKKEVEKLTFLVGKGGTVTTAHVEEHVVKDVEYKIYELTQAAGRGSYATFSEILFDLLQKGYDEHAVLSSLTSYYRTLCEVSTMRGTDGEVASALGMKPYAVQKNREQARAMGKERVSEFYFALYNLSCGAKNGEYNKEGALFSAIAKIFFA